MKKAMISQPMNDRPPEQIKHDRERAIKYLEKLGYEYVDTYISEPAPERNPALWFFARIADIMRECDLVLFIGDWQNARGCQAEYYLCRNYGVESMQYFEEDDKE